MPSASGHGPPRPAAIEPGAAHHPPQAGRLQSLLAEFAGAIDQANGATTKSPFFTVRTSVPVDSTTR